MDGAQKDNATRFEELNAGQPVGTIVLRPDLSFAFDERARVAFEYFCFRHDELPLELDSFLEFSAERRHLLDIGALFGIFSLCFCKKNRESRTAIAVDPSPQAFEILIGNLRLNADLQINPLNIAAGQSEGEIFMKTEWMHLVAQKISAPDTVSIRTRPIDAIVLESGYEPDVVKIDVEGYEKSVLVGMKDTIKRFHPDIHIEIHPAMLRDLGESPEEVFESLRSLDYEAFRPDRSIARNFTDLDGSCLTSYWVHKSRQR